MSALPEDELTPAGRPDLDPHNMVLRGPDGVPVPLRQQFAAQHPFMYLTSFALVVVVVVLALAVGGGAAAHGLLRLVLWAWVRT